MKMINVALGLGGRVREVPGFRSIAACRAPTQSDSKAASKLEGTSGNPIWLRQKRSKVDILLVRASFGTLSRWPQHSSLKLANLK